MDFIVQKDFLNVVKGVKSVNQKSNKKDVWFKRRCEFASLTRQGYSMCQIAEQYGITRQAVSLALQKAVKEGEIVHKTRSNVNDDPNYKVISRKKLREIKCVSCNNIFITDKKRKTCSAKCKADYKQKTYGGEWSRMAYVELSCAGCGKSFKRSKYLHKINESKRTSKSNYYCSRRCYCETRKPPLQVANE